MEANNKGKDSIIPDSHYNLIAQERGKYLSGKIETSSWVELEKRLRKKFDF